jgi:hypothetical protein
VTIIAYYLVIQHLLHEPPEDLISGLSLLILTPTCKVQYTIFNIRRSMIVIAYLVIQHVLHNKPAEGLISGLSLLTLTPTCTVQYQAL